MDIGISSFTYSWAIGVPGKEPEICMTAYDLIDKAVEFQVPIVQIADNLPLHNFSASELSEIKDYAEKSGIRIEVGSRKMTASNLSEYIALAAFFNSPILRFVIDGPGFEPSKEEIDQIIKNAIPDLEQNGTILALENHDRFSAVEYREIIENADSSWVGICLDSVNSMGAGDDINTIIKVLAPLTVNLHMKEFMISRISHQMGFVIEGRPLGNGMLPVQKLLDEVGKECGSVILEQWAPPETELNKTIEKELDWSVKSIRYLKQIMNS